MLHSDIVVALYGAGLDPYIGFYHGLSFGRESLAADLIEPQRPAVDRFVLKLFAAGHLRPENFSGSAQGCLLGKAGRARFYPLYEEAAEDFRKRITRSVSDLVTFLRQRGVDDGLVVTGTPRNEEDLDYERGAGEEPEDEE
jgi:CRISPR-associated protein Cas1